MAGKIRNHGRTRDNMSLDDFANKDILDVDDVRYLQRIWPEISPDVAAAKLAERVERAPQYCRFLTFERLNLLGLYKLQHDILTYQLPQSPAPSTSSLLAAPGSVGGEALMSPAVSFSTPRMPSQVTSSAARIPVASSSAMPSSQPRFSSKAVSSSQPMPEDDLESMGIFNGRLDNKLMSLIREYNEALRLFKEMQSWSRATSESCAIARSDFAFHFREEKYVLSRESMYDLSPRGGPSDTDGVRKWLIEKLPLRYVNPAAWDLRRTRQDRAPRGDSPNESYTNVVVE